MPCKNATPPLCLQAGVLKENIKNYAYQISCHMVQVDTIKKSKVGGHIQEILNK